VRATLLVIAALATGLLLAACGGGSGDRTANLGNETITVPADVQGIYPELEAVLAQFPYQRWYTNCLIATVKKELSPKEAEELENSPGSNGAAKAEEIIAAAVPACEASKRPVIDPNASAKELALYRAGNVERIAKYAESEGFEGAQIECIEEAVEKLPVSEVVSLGNGTHKVREGILVSVLAHCVKAE
jgi:hypothetical protein